MARRAPTTKADRLLADVEALIPIAGAGPLQPAHLDLTATAMQQGIGLAVAAATKVLLAVPTAARTPGLHVPLLRKALARLLDQPGDDAQCHGKLAALSTLETLGDDDDVLPRRCAAHIQMEPVWGGQEDSAPRLRVRAVQILIRQGSPDLYRLTGDLLGDASAEARGAAAQLLSELGGERAVLLLRLGLRGERRPEVVGDIATALLACDGERSIDLVAVLVEKPARDADPNLTEAATLALGGSRLPQALAPLQRALTTTVDSERQQTLITAIAMLRQDAAVEVLLNLAEEASPTLAAAAIEGLQWYLDRPKVMERLRMIEQRSKPNRR